jgi:phage shock protein C
MENKIKKFYRSRNDRVIFGVCGGLAEYFQIDGVLIRALFVLLTFTGGFGILLYLILAVVTPLEPKKSGEAIPTIDPENFTDKHNFLGVIVIFLGLVLLLQQIFRFYFNWSLLVAILILCLGVYILIKDAHKK